MAKDKDEIVVHWKPRAVGGTACGSEADVSVGPSPKWVTCRLCLEKAATVAAIGKEAQA